MNIGIAGAGLLGRLLAYRLASLGHAVHVFDPASGANELGASAWTAAGMLSPTAELECANEDVFNLGLRSLELWPQILAGLDQPVELHQRGSLLLAHRGDEGAAQRVVDLLIHKAPADHAPKNLTNTQLRELEPSVHGPAHAWLLPFEGCINPIQALQALTQDAIKNGASFSWLKRAKAVNCHEIATSDGSNHFDWVFDTRGTGARPDLPVRGVRGEIITLHAPGVQLARPVRLLHPRHRVYLVPRAGGHIMVGASEIESEDRSAISLRTTVELLAAAHSVLPELAEARVAHSETNLRPALPDNLPHIEQQDGLTRINGLFRHGWLIAPALVERVLAVLKFPSPSRGEGIELENSQE